MSAPESSSPEALPGHKAKKYDRQLRLWGDHGQSALESAKVCLINATATGTEILKNVILPGVGSFTIVDGNKISGEDVGNNFFLDKDAIGQSRAKISTDLLLELNDDVHGDFVEESVDNLLDNDSRFFDNFTIVIATDLPERSLLRLASVLWEAGVPLMVCRSYGFIGYIRMVLKEHTVVESHPDSTHEDLRLDRPFQALSAYCDSLHLEAMSKKDHSHTPWLVLIFKYLQKWKAEHEGAGPKNYREKNQLKELIREGILKNDEGVPADEENFDEAITHVNASLVPTQIPSYVKQLFEDQSCLSINSESKPFWILTRALKEYVDNEGQGALPLRGSIPDMTSDSERYIALQNVYKSKADSDMQMFSQYVQTLQETLGRDEPLTSERYRSPSSSPGKPQDLITDADVKLFCKNASFLRVIRTRSLAEEYDQSTANISELAMHIENGDDDDVIFYVMLRAVDKYYAEFSSYPGTYLDSLEADIPKLKSSLNKVLQEWGISHQVKDEYVHELCRYGAAELHSVAAYIGGTAAQEAIKVITEQFVPVNNTYIYNAMKQSSTTIQL